MLCHVVRTWISCLCCEKLMFILVNTNFIINWDKPKSLFSTDSTNILQTLVSLKNQKTCIQCCINNNVKQMSLFLLFSWQSTYLSDECCYIVSSAYLPNFDKTKLLLVRWLSLMDHCPLRLHMTYSRDDITGHLHETCINWVSSLLECVVKIVIDRLYIFVNRLQSNGLMN